MTATPETLSLADRVRMLQPDGASGDYMDGYETACGNLALLQPSGEQVPVGYINAIDAGLLSNLIMHSVAAVTVKVHDEPQDRGQALFTHAAGEDTP